jgi:hypothetical protein
MAEIAGLVREGTGLDEGRQKVETRKKLKPRKKKRANLGMCCDSCKILSAENGFRATTFKIRTLESEP